MGQTTLQLPTKVLTIDLAVHPGEGWPAVASVVWSGNEDPDRVVVSVLHPATQQWSSVRQVDLGPARIGRYQRTVAVAISPDRVVSVVWAMSDPDFRDNDPPAGMWLARSHDFGQSWSAPEWVGSDCPRVNDLVALPDGQLVVQAICSAGPRVGVPTYFTRLADGQWAAPERLPIPVWLYSEGSLVVSGHGAAAQLVGVVLAGQQGQAVAYLNQRRLAGGTWQTTTRALPLALDAGERMWSVRGIAYDRPQPAGTTQAAISFTWTGADAPQGVYALTSLDGGTQWGPIEPIMLRGRDGARLLFASTAYDPLADRLVTFFTCCADASWEWVETTHYARWSAPGSGIWASPGGEDSRQLVPLALGARAAAQTVTAQASGSSRVWLAWIDTLQQVVVRSLPLNQLIPVQEYPTTTPIVLP
jgi:hypothetical protein